MQVHECQKHSTCRMLKWATKKPSKTFHYTGCFIGILMFFWQSPKNRVMWSNPLYSENNQGFFHCSNGLERENHQLPSASPRAGCSFLEKILINKHHLGSIWEVNPSKGSTIVPQILATFDFLSLQMAPQKTNDSQGRTFHRLVFQFTVNLHRLCQKWCLKIHGPGRRKLVISRGP